MNCLNFATYKKAMMIYLRQSFFSVFENFIPKFYRLNAASKTRFIVSKKTIFFKDRASSVAQRLSEKKLKKLRIFQILKKFYSPREIAV